MDSRRGFTLVELMASVVIITILVTLAYPSLSRHFRSARAKSEVIAMFAEIKIKEEAYEAERGNYLSSSLTDGESDLWPVLLGQGEPAPKFFLPAPATNWAAIGVATDRTQVYCGYVVIAGPPGRAPTGTQGAKAFENRAPTTKWWYAVAQCDQDGKGPPNATFAIAHDRTTLFQENEGQ